VAEQHWRDVQVDLVDEPSLEKLSADRGREALAVLATRGRISAIRPGREHSARD
jgi:hypothetical protein